uniref:Uncharacterized protein n=1 Tax=Oryza punctata TaxID=4537 RepID=A0A0E0L7L1_ORYPU
MALLPTFVTATIQDLHVLAMLDEPRSISLPSIPAVRLAPEFVAAITAKVEQGGWICNRLQDLQRVSRFDDLLADLKERIIPKLRVHPNDLAALRNLRRCGKGMWRLRQHAHPSVFDLVGLYSNSLTRAARQGLDPYKAYVIKQEWLTAMEHRVEESRSSFVSFDLENALPATLMPIVTISSLADVRGLVFVIEPHCVELGAVDAVRLAPEYLDIILEKVEQEGWICPVLPALRQVVRFANLLAELQDRVLPDLRNHRNDRAVLRKLRSCGCGMWKLRRVASGPLLRLTRIFSNNLTRKAREALDSRKAFVIPTEWINKMAARAEMCRNSLLHLHHQLGDEIQLDNMPGELAGDKAAAAVFRSPQKRPKLRADAPWPATNLAHHRSQANLAGIKAAAIATIASAVPTLASVRMLPWAKANINPTGQALIVCTAAGMAYFVAADKNILSLARKHSFENAPEHLKNTSFQGTGRPHPAFFRP